MLDVEGLDAVLIGPNDLTTNLGIPNQYDHPRYGEGIILESEAMGARHVIRVNFFDHGTMALILGAEDVGPA